MISFRLLRPWGLPRHIAARYMSSHGSRDEKMLREELNLPGVFMDEIDEICTDVELHSLDKHYPNLDLTTTKSRKPFEGHNLMVIQPWISYANFNESTDPDIQLEECVSLGNTIHNWNVVDKRIVFANQVNRKHILSPKAFNELKSTVIMKKDVSAVFFGVELLSGVQLSALEQELRMPVFDRFTMVLNIFRQHAKTKEAKIQLALAELPYIRSHLRQIHESSEYSSTKESLKLLIGGAGEKFYHQRLSILKRRESRLKFILEDLRKQRDVNKRLRKKSDLPVVSVVGYTNSGKTSLIKYLTADQKLVPEDKLFATLDVTLHHGKLPSSKTVLYVDTVGFISRIPLLLVEAFAATLQEIQESDLIVHVLDVTHPDHKLQYETVMKSLQSLKIPKALLESMLTLGNKVDKLGEDQATPRTLPKCDLHVSIMKDKNMNKFVELMSSKLLHNLKHETVSIRVKSGGLHYNWLMKHATIIDCKPDEADPNYLICRVIWSPMASGRYYKLYQGTGVIPEENL